MALGIALGVAVVVSIDLANASAERAFELSTASVAGKATNEIVAGPDGIDQSLYVKLRTEGIGVPFAPVIDQVASSPQLGSRPLELLGIDPFAETPFRDYLGGGQSFSSEELAAFLTRPGAVMISQDTAMRYGLSLGSSIQLGVNGRRMPAFIAGMLTAGNDLARQTLDGLVLADISTAQELAGRIGKIDRIDVILPPGDSTAQRAIQAALPPGVRIEPSAAESGSLAEMTAAFRINLTALSLLALVVGLFLIYNSMTFSVVQRRTQFGALRCLGVTRREILSMVLGEALIIGVLGAGVGLGLGILLSKLTVSLVTRTINDLYFATTVQAGGLPASVLVKGALLGVVATVLTAILPAWEAASSPPSAAMSRSGLEQGARRAVYRVALAGVISLALGAGIFAIPTRSVQVGFLGTFAVVAGFAMLSGLALKGLMLLASPLSGRLFGLVGRMAPRNLAGALSRTAIAIAALMVAVAVTIGVGMMIDSFRYTVEVWLQQTLSGDIYVTSPGITAAAPGAPLDPAVVQALEHWPGVNHVDLLRSVTVDTPNGPVEVSATNDTGIGGQRLFASHSVAVDQIWPELEKGAVLVSEPLASRLNIPARGGQLTLYTDKGSHTFPVVGVYYDYSSSQGIVMMAMDVYRSFWRDNGVTAAALHLAPGESAPSTVHALQDALSTKQQLSIRANQTLRRDVMAVFDRTFAITGALQILTTIVAFIGVLSALLTLELEKQREAGILRAIGLTVRQLWGLVILETGWMGVVAGLLAMPTGYVLSLILIYIINRRSFGWTLQMSIQVAPFVEALAVAVLAALLAGIYPARRIGRIAAAEAIRYE
jgi:putative ABC transport system permease protein